MAVKGKHYLSDADVEKLLDDNVTLTEKADGANVGLVRIENYFKLQKRGSLIEDNEHYQYNYLKAWSQTNYDKLMQIPKDTILYAEWMAVQHTIFYDMLPSYFLAFAWYDRKIDKYHHWYDMEELCDKIGLCTVPLIQMNAKVNKDELLDFIPNPSCYGHEQAEGLVVTNYQKQMRGKVVLKKFQDSMDTEGHWATKKIVKNIVSDKCHCEDKE